MAVTVDSIARAIGLDSDQLCQACITAQYPAGAGRRLAAIAYENHRNGVTCRTYETAETG